MALNSLFCADVPLSNYSLTHLASLSAFCCIIQSLRDNDVVAGHQRRMTLSATIPTGVLLPPLFQWKRLCSRLTALWRYINFVLLLLLL